MSKRIIATFLLSAFIATFSIYCQQRKKLEKDLPELPEQAPHAFLIHFPNENIAYSCNYQQSTWLLMANKNWQFKKASINDRNIAYYSLTRYNASEWSRSENIININDSIENISRDECILYRTVIPIPEEWYGLQVAIRIESISPEIVLWVNGRKISHSKTSDNGCSFIITPAIIFGRLNTILIQQMTVKKVKIRNESNVIISAFPNVAINDVYYKTQVLDSNNVKIKFAIFAKKFLPDISEKFYLCLNIYDKKQKPLISEIHKTFNPSKKKDSIIYFDVLLKDIHLWSKSNPYNYSLVVSVRNKKDEVVDAIGHKIGFRDIGSNNNDVILNDKTVPSDSIAEYDFIPFNKIHQLNKEGINIKINVLSSIISNDFTNSDEVIENNSYIEMMIRKKIMHNRNYTNVIAWGIEGILDKNKIEWIKKIILKYDDTRPIIVK